MLARVGAEIDPRVRLRDLGIANKHLVAVARALSIDARVVIMDEPTAALSHKEIAELFELVEKLKAEGKAILFISHKFDEIFRIADRYTVFRDGRAGRRGPDGRGHRGRARPPDGRPLGRRDLPEARRAARRGGARRSPAIATRPSSTTSASPCAGARSSASTAWSAPAAASSCRRCSASPGPSKGVVTIDGRVAVDPLARPTRSRARHRLRARGPRPPGRGPRRCRSSRTSRCPRSRAPRAAASCASPRSSALAREYTERLDLRAAALDQDVGQLSGGNQQKVVIAKWLATQPRVIILDEPTKGIDIGSKAAVHDFMAELAAQGLAVIMVSSEIPEILGMSDRVIVMREGRIVGDLRPRRADPRAARPRRRRHQRRSPDARPPAQVARDPARRRHRRCWSLLIALRFPGFAPPANLANVFNDTSILIMLALGQMAVILTKCIDLSVAANLALTGMVVAMLNAACPGRAGRRADRCSPSPSAPRSARSTASSSGSSTSRRSSSRSAR